MKSIYSSGSISIALPSGTAGTYGVTVDVNAASGTVSAINVGAWSQNYMNMLIKNSYSGSTATATLNFGSSLSLIGGATDQKQSIIFDAVTATVAATASTIGSDVDAGARTSTIQVNSGAAVTWTGKVDYYASGKLIVNGTYTYTGSTTSTFRSGSSLAVASGATLTLNNSSAVSIQSGATATINGAVTLASTNIFTVAGTAAFSTTSSMSVNSGSSFTVSAGGSATFAGNSTLTFGPGNYLYLYGSLSYNKAITFYQVTTAGTFTQTGGDGITLARPSAFNSGAAWTVINKFTLAGNRTDDDTALTRSKVTLNAGSHMYISGTNNRVIFNDGTLILNQANAVLTDAAGYVTLVTTDNTALKNRMYVNADQTFKNIYVNLSALEIYMDNISVLSFVNDGAQTVSYTGTGQILIYNFRENSIFVGTDSATKDAVENCIDLYNSESELLGNASVSSTGFLTLVPEPSEWAAIFGAVALGFAVYRRRK